MREESIAVSGETKNRLDSTAEDLFGTADVPFGATVTALIEYYQTSAQGSENNTTTN